MTRTRMPAGYYYAWHSAETMGVYTPERKLVDACRNKQDAIRIAWEHKEENRPMTLAQARAKAKRRWGKGAKAWKSKYSIRVIFYVGIKGKGYESYYGTGPTFEAAFADADMRKAEAKEMMSNGT